MPLVALLLDEADIMREMKAAGGLPDGIKRCP